MEALKLYKGKQAELNSIPLQAGSFYFCEDTGNIYIDTDTQRVQLNAHAADFLRTNDKQVSLSLPKGEVIVSGMWELEMTAEEDEILEPSIGMDAVKEEIRTQIDELRTELQEEIKTSIDEAIDDSWEALY